MILTERLLSLFGWKLSILIEKLRKGQMSATRARRRHRRPGRGRRAGGARFCHLIHIITGVSLLYGGGELIAPVTVSSVPYLCAHGEAGEQVPPESLSACEPCTRCAAIRFWGVIP